MFRAGRAVKRLAALLMALMVALTAVTAFAGEKDSYTVTFHANGHGTAPAPVEVPAGESFWSSQGGSGDVIPWYAIPDEGWKQGPSLWLDPEATEYFNIYEPVNSDVDVYYTWEPVDTVDTVEVLFTAPDVGDPLNYKPQVALTEWNNVEIGLTARSFYDAEGKFLGNSFGQFEEGKTYYVSFRLGTATDQVFAGGKTLSGSCRGGSLHVTVNGESADAYIEEDYTDVSVTVKVPFRPGHETLQPTAQAGVTLEIPQVGANVRADGYAKVTASSNCCVQRAIWQIYNENIISYGAADLIDTRFDPTFRAGENYCVQIILMPQEGCCFTEDTVVTVNGSSAYYWRYMPSPTEGTAGSIWLIVPVEAEYATPAGQNAEMGDLDGDGEVTDADAIYLLMYTFFPEEYAVKGSCDYDGDGEVTDGDAIYLLMYTFFPEEYPIPCPGEPED